MIDEYAEQPDRPTPEFVYTAVVGTNADLFEQIDLLYFQPSMRVVDLTYGRGIFWQKVNLSKFAYFWGVDIDEELVRRAVFTGDPIYKADFRHLPPAVFPDGDFDLVVLDPPYMHGGATVKESINKCYLNQNTSHESVVRLYTGGILEAARILKKGGLLVLKTQNEIESGVQRMTAHELVTILQILGFRIEEEFVLVQAGMPAQREQRQLHARKNHSFAIVARLRR